MPVTLSASLTPVPTFSAWLLPWEAGPEGPHRLTPLQLALGPRKALARDQGVERERAGSVSFLLPPCSNSAAPATAASSPTTDPYRPPSSMAPALPGLPRQHFLPLPSVLAVRAPCRHREPGHPLCKSSLHTHHLGWILFPPETLAQPAPRIERTGTEWVRN